MWTNNEAGSEMLGETVCRVIHDLWPLMREMIPYDFVTISSYKHASDLGRLRSYGHLKLRIEGKGY